MVPASVSTSKQASVELESHQRQLAGDTKFGGIRVNRRIESSKPRADAFPHAFARLFHARNVVKQRAALQAERA